MAPRRSVSWTEILPAASEISTRTRRISWRILFPTLVNLTYTVGPPGLLTCLVGGLNPAHVPWVAGDQTAL